MKKFADLNSDAKYSALRYATDPKYREYMKAYHKKWAKRNRKFINKQSREAYARLTKKQKKKRQKHIQKMRDIGLWKK